MPLPFGRSHMRKAQSVTGLCDNASGLRATLAESLFARSYGERL